MLKYSYVVSKYILVRFASLTPSLIYPPIILACSEMLGWLCVILMNYGLTIASNEGSVTLRMNAQMYCSTHYIYLQWAMS